MGHFRRVWTVRESVERRSLRRKEGTETTPFGKGG